LVVVWLSGLIYIGIKSKKLDGKHHKPINKFKERYIVSQRRKVESNAQIKILLSTL